MRKLPIILAALAVLALTGCDDGGSDGAHPRSAFLPEGELLDNMAETEFGYRLAKPRRAFMVLLFLSPIPGQTAHPAILESVRMMNPSQGLMMLTPSVTTVREGGSDVPFGSRYPPKAARNLRPVNGFRVTEGTTVLLGLKVNEPGRFTADAFRIRYSVGDQEYEALYTMKVTVTAKT